MKIHHIALTGSLLALALLATTGSAQSTNSNARLTRTQAAAARAMQDGRFIRQNVNALAQQQQQQQAAQAQPPADFQPGDANGVTRNADTAPILGPAFANPPVTADPPNGAVGIRTTPANPNGSAIQQGNGRQQGNAGNNAGSGRFSGGMGQGQVGAAMPPNFGDSGYGGGYLTGGGGVFQDPYGYSAMGDYLHGEADVVRSQGEYNLSTAAAWSTAEDARSKSYDNAKKYVSTYFERKAIHDSYVSPRTSPSYRAYRQESLERLQRESEQAKKLNRKQFDSALATIYWPGVLKGREFARHRVEIENLMAQRSTQDSGLGSDNYRQVRQATEAMTETLRDEVLEIPSDEYMVAKKFIDGLKHEARLTADQAEQVAQD